MRGDCLNQDWAVPLPSFPRKRESKPPSLRGPVCPSYPRTGRRIADSRGVGRRGLDSRLRGNDGWGRESHESQFRQDYAKHTSSGLARGRCQGLSTWMSLRQAQPFDKLRMRGSFLSGVGFVYADDFCLHDRDALD